jgi:hypothetical protein
MATAVCLKKERQCKKEWLHSFDQFPVAALCAPNLSQRADWTPVGDLPLQHTFGPLTISLVGARPLKLWS